MYGTVARIQVKAGAEKQFTQITQEIEGERAPGQVAVYVYQMDRNPREFFMAVLFESRDTYFANAESPEQHQRFLKLMQVLEAEPEWHDGEVVYATS